MIEQHMLTFPPIFSCNTVLRLAHLCPLAAERTRALPLTVLDAKPWKDTCFGWWWNSCTRDTLFTNIALESAPQASRDRSLQACLSMAHHRRLTSCSLGLAPFISNRVLYQLDWSKGRRRKRPRHALIDDWPLTHSCIPYSTTRDYIPYQDYLHKTQSKIKT